MGKAKKAQQTLFDFETIDVPIGVQPFSLPKNWISTKLTNIVSVVTGKKNADYGRPNGLYSFFTCASEPITCDGYSFEGESLVLPGNGANVGQVTYFNGRFEAYQRTYVLQLTSQWATLKYVYYHLLAFWKDYNSNKQYGSATNFIKIGNFVNYEIPLPPLPEQKRIVELIESLFSRLDEARAKAQEVIDGFEPWKSAILHKAITGQLVEQRPEEGTSRELLKKVQLSDKFGGQKVKQKNIKEISEDEKTIVIPPNWEWVKLGSVCIIARGGSPRPIKDFITTSDDGVNWIKIGDTQKNGKYISTCAEKIKPSGVSKSRMVHAGDFLLTNSMSFGRPYILKISGCIHDGWLVISQPSEVFDQDFLYWLLSSSYAFSQFCGQVSGAVVENLNSDKVANSVFPLPPLPEQKRIVSQIESLISRMEEAVEKAKSVIEQIDVIKKSILAKAFRGELGTNDPTEESALEILKSSGAERKKRAS